MRKLLKKVRIVAYQFYISGALRLVLGCYALAIIGGLGWFAWEQQNTQSVLIAQVEESAKIAQDLTSVALSYEELKSQDQVAVNASLSAEIANIQKTYEAGAKLFEERADLVILAGKVSTIDKELAKFLNLLGDKKWQEANEQVVKVQAEIAKVVVANTPKVTTPAITSVTASNALPGSGYTRQKVATGKGEFVISMVVAPGAKVVIETAGDSDCGNNCPTKSLAEHVAASGGFAGINGAYFCPPDYAQCQSKINSFDTLAVNGRSKAVLNRANNVYSTVPLITSYGNKLTFYDQTVQWGVDTGSNGALANYPRLLRDGSTATGEENGKGTRGFIGTKDGAVVIGHVYAASFADTAEVLKTLGLQNAMNLDGGGSSALWYEGGYKVGPGRSLPTAVVLVR